MSETNQNTSLTQAINDMRTMRESYNQLGAAAEAYNAGKTQLVENLNSKGVPASASETLPELAGKVAQITQDTIIYDGADSYGKQIGAGGSLWDLYQVLADMKTRFMGTGDYAALAVCEYYKGYDSLTLTGADHYYTCDGDFYDYGNPTHVWHDDDNGKMNRWVCFLYRQEGANFEIRNTDISPRSIYIGGHIGTIEYFVSGRLTELVCGIEETDVLDNFLPKDYIQNWNKYTNINVGNTTQFVVGNPVFFNAKTTDTLRPASGSNIFKGDASYVHITTKVQPNLDTNTAIYSQAAPNTLIGFAIDGPCGSTSSYNRIIGIYNANDADKALRFIHVPGFTSGTIVNSNFLYVLNDLMVGENTESFSMRGWKPNYLSDAAQKAVLIDNIKNHILAKVRDCTGETQRTFTISTGMYNDIASEQIEWQGETMSLADAFLTKNWALAGA